MYSPDYILTFKEPFALVSSRGGEAGSHGLVVNTRSSVWLTWLLVRLTWVLVHFSQKYHALTENSVVLELIKGKLKK